MADKPKVAKCGAKTRAGGTCIQPAANGTTRCRYHGGSAPQAIAAAERRKQEAIAVQAVQTYGLPVDVSPTQALLDEVRWTAGHVAWLRQQVQALEAEALTWGKTEEAEKTATEFPGTDVTRKAVPNIWLDLYQRERKHLVDVCRAAIAANIDERMVRLAERQGELLVEVIQAILSDLNLTAEQVARVPEVVPRHLRAIAGGAAS